MRTEIVVVMDDLGKPSVRAIDEVESPILACAECATEDEFDVSYPPLYIENFEVKIERVYSEAAHADLITRLTKLRDESPQF
jgi:hypothetical protein